MLEIRNLTKVYRSKTGEQVRALDNISVSFPGNGMVFILGKSGSGKSTLLNVMGGLDSYDSGEFIIMGRSSKDFVGSDFDAYRNTFIGFIFQEYNVLDDFTVGANIGLALELQGKKATNEQITEILNKVDLLQFAHRKPNELSGGQKQRIAIARALVKDPQIIMADEPTGALDSNTGKQIFDTLKELSKEKLVLVVSHDRDFAERYADRIIELSDGKIISDVTKHEVMGAELSEGIHQISNHILRIKPGYQLTGTDVEMINNYLRQSKNGLMVSGDQRVNQALCSTAGITENGGTSIFEGTVPEKDIHIKEYDAKKTKFIRSHLPAKNAIKMGASGFKHKRFRLVLTILLSCISFAMFGLADTMAAYDKVTAATESIMEGRITNASVSVGVRHTYYYDGGETGYRFQTDRMNDQDIAFLQEKTGLAFVPVYNGTSHAGTSFSLRDMMISEEKLSEAYQGSLSGFVNLSADDVRGSDMTLTGRMPSAPGEIAISEFIYRQLNASGFKNTLFSESVPAGRLTMADNGSADSLIGKHLTICDVSYKVVGIVDTRFDYTRYDAFLPKENKNTNPDDQNFAQLLLSMELSDTLTYGFHTLGFLTESDIVTLSNSSQGKDENIGQYVNIGNVLIRPSGDSNNAVYASFYRMGGSELLSRFPVTFFDGNSRTQLAGNEYIISMDALAQWYSQNSETIAPSPMVFRTLASELINESIVTQKWQEAEKANLSIGVALNNAVAFDYVTNTLLAEKRAALTQKFEDANARSPINDKELIEFCVQRMQEMPANALVTGAKSLDTVMAEFDAEFLLKAENLLGLPNVEQAREGLKQKIWDLMSGSNISSDWFTVVFYSYAAYADTIAGELYNNPSFINEMQKIDASFTERLSGAADLNEKINLTADAYSFYLYNTLSEANRYGDKTGSELFYEGQSAMFACSEMSREDFLSSFLRVSIASQEYNGSGYEPTVTDLATFPDLKLVGVFGGPSSTSCRDLIISDTIVSKEKELCQSNSYGYEEVAEHVSGIWAFAIAPMPKDRQTVQNLVVLNYQDDGDLQFRLQNQVMNTLNNFNDIIETLSKVFLYVGLGFAVFSSLLLMNFIAVSISYKKREIGILRAVGARSSDVFKIFFSESMIIALINYVLSVIATISTVVALNRWMAKEGINVKLLSFGIRQLALMLLISVAVAAISSFLPVFRIARKKPVDAIKDR